jgi:hypothetical protein
LASSRITVPQTFPVGVTRRTPGTGGNRLSLARTSRFTTACSPALAVPVTAPDVLTEIRTSASR